MQVNPYDSGIIPLGGIGAGCFCLDRQGRLHSHITYPSGSSVYMENTWPVVRVEPVRGSVYMRRLCGAESTDTSAQTKESAPAFLALHQYRQLLNYPVVTYQLRDEAAPVRLVWSFFSPLIPYDHTASVMPAVFLGVRLVNTLQQPVFCSVLFNMDALPLIRIAGHSSPSLHAVRVTAADDARQHLGAELFRGAVAQTESHILDDSYVLNALLFGERRQADGGPQPQLLLCAKEYPEATLSSTFWDVTSSASRADFWGGFSDSGELAYVPPDANTHAGALCVATKIPPGGSRRVDFVLSWHLPPAACEQFEVGVAYGKSFLYAPDVARYGLKHLGYLFSALSNWHKQLTSSSLPLAFVEQLMWAGRSFITHARYTRAGGLQLASLLPPDASVSTLDWDYFSASALLLFAPRFHAGAVSTCLAELESLQHQDTPSQALCCAQAELVLSAYADILSTGNRARLCDWYPKMKAMGNTILTRLMSDDVERDAHAEEAAVLWTAAAQALASMAHLQNDSDGHARFDAAGHSLEQRLARHLDGVTAELAEGSVSKTTRERLFAALPGLCIATLLHLPLAAHAAPMRDIVRTDWFVSSSEGGAARCRMRQTVALLTAKLLYGVWDTELPEAPELSAVLEHFAHAVEALDKDPACAGVNKLGVWTLLQAVTGFQYDALHSILRIRPAPLGLNESTLPVFTPVSLGKMDVRLESGPDKIVMLRVYLDSPLIVKTIVIELPVVFPSPKVSCAHETETLHYTQQAAATSIGTTLRLQFRSPLKLTDMLSIRLRE